MSFFEKFVSKFRNRNSSSVDSQVAQVVALSEEANEKERLQSISNLAARMNSAESLVKIEKHIVCNNKNIEINWPKVILWTEEGGMGYKKTHYKEQKTRNPRMFVVHWDVCLDTKSMVRVTKERGLSVHFGIDNDGTIYQLMDTKDIAWHAKGINSYSVGVEISNGVSPKFNEYYRKMGFKDRALVNSAKIHGKQIGPYLDFYPEQLAALKALTLALHRAHSISLETPTDDSGKPLTTVSDDVQKGTFNGVVGHFHSTLTKIDPGILDINKILEEIKKDVKN